MKRTRQRSMKLSITISASNQLMGDVQQDGDKEGNCRKRGNEERADRETEEDNLSDIFYHPLFLCQSFTV